MKILHTSDWHLGRRLLGRTRYSEFESFLNWLGDLMAEEHIDVLVNAGDVFDNTTPGNRSQELYYKFLNRIAASKCRHVVIIGGNHDSPSFLNAPKELLSFLNVHVVGAARKEPEKEVFVLKDGAGKEELIVLAVPYLRDKDIRSVEPGEGVKVKEDKLIEGIRAHYKSAGAIAEKINNRLYRGGKGRKVPVIALGHLFAAGGKIRDGDGVRDLYIGSLARVRADLFPGIIDYTALGHLHTAQKVAGLDYIRYSGSPLPMGFSDAFDEKKVLIVKCSNKEGSDRINVKEVMVPRFREFVQIRGDLNQIKEQINKVKAGNSLPWVEIIYTGDELPGNLRNMIDDMMGKTDIEILRIKNDRISIKILEGQNLEQMEHNLENMDEFDVFKKCLKIHDIPESQHSDLMNSFREIVKSMLEEV